MRTTERNKNNFESKPLYLDNVYSSDEERSFKQFENQHFVVPWQMEKTKDRKVKVE